MISSFVNLVFITFGIVHIAGVSVVSSSVQNTLTQEDKEVLENYLNNNTEKPIDNLPIKTHILNKLTQGKTNLEIWNGLSLIHKLTDQHQKHFDSALIVFLKREIQTDLPYLQYRLDGGNFVQGLMALGATRTERSINFLMSLVDPPENWPRDIRAPVFNNPDSEEWIREIRIKSMGALLQPLDEPGKELLGAIKEKVNLFPPNDLKTRMLESVERWKRIYSEAPVFEFPLHEN